MTENENKKKLIITFDKDNIPPSLNGAGGLINMHFRARKQKKESIMWYILDQNKEKISFADKVRVTTIKHSSRLMDWENLASVFKLVGDALIDLDIIVDDSPKYITKFEMFQEKSTRIDARYIVEIEEV